MTAAGAGLLGVALLAMTQQAATAQLEPAAVPPPTRLATELQHQRRLVAVTRTVAATNLGIGTAVVRLTIEERLAGGPLGAGDDALVFAYAGDFVPGGHDLVHLEPFGRGGRWAVRQRVDGRDPDYRAKLDTTRRTLLLLAQSDPGQREAAAFTLLLALLEAPDAWSRGYATNELLWMARNRRVLFTAERVRRLSRLAADSPHAAVRSGVESVAILLSLDDDSLPPPPQSESSSR